MDKGNTWGILSTEGQLKSEGKLKSNSPLTDKEKDETPKVSDPFSPANTGLPVVIYDEDGNRVGNVWSPSQNGLKEAIANRESGNATAVYFDFKTGKFTNYPSSTMSYKDGKINLNVSNDVANTDWYKEAFNGQLFKDLAKAYAADPTGKSEIEISNSDGTKEKKTINDLLKEFAEDLEESSKKYQGNIDTRNNVKRITGGALDLTDEDIAVMGTFKNFKKESFSDTDAIFLPDVVKEYFKDYSSYDDETGTISAKDFYDSFYHLNTDVVESVQRAINDLGGGALGDSKEALKQISESDKDYAIDLIRLKTSEAMVDLVTQTTFNKDDMTEEDKAYASSQYAKCFALYQLMTQDTPNTDSWTGFNLAVQNFAVGFDDGIITAGEGIVHFYSQLASCVVDGGVRTAAAINTPFSWFGELLGNLFSGGWDKMTQETRNMYEHFDEWYSNNTNESSVLGEMRKSIDELGKAIENREDLAGKLFESAEQDMAKSYANAAAMQHIGRIGGLILTQIVATNPIGQAVGGAFEVGLLNAGSVALTGYKFDVLVNMAKTFSMMATTANNVTSALKYMKILASLRVSSTVAGFMVNMYMQGIVDTFVENPALTDAMLYGESNDKIADFQNALRWNILWNTVGEAAPFAGKKGIKWVKNTSFGAVAQASLRKATNFFTLPGRQMYEGIAEFMTRRSKEFIVEEGSEVPFSGKLNPEKRWQAIRREIIKIQKEIKDTNIFRGEGSWTDNAKKIDDLIQARIDLEEVLGTSKKLFVAQARQRIIQNAGLDIESAEISQYTAELSNLAKKMKQTNMPGSFSKETGDYINDLFNRQLLLNKQAFLETSGKVAKNLSKKELKGLSILNKRIADYEASLPANFADSYKAAVNKFMDSNYRYYKKLKDFLASDAGGNIVLKEDLDFIRSNSQYGTNGEMWMPLYAVSGFKSAEDLEALLKDPSRIMREGKTTSQVDNYSRKTFSPDVTYLDPNYTRDIVTNSYAKVMNAADMSDAVVRAGRATSIPTDSQGNILKTPKDVAAAKKNLYNDLQNKFESSFRENLQFLGPETIKSTKVKAKDYYNQVKRGAQRTVNDILGLDSKGLRTYASTLNSSEIEQINKVYSLPEYSRKIRTVEDLNAMYGSLSSAQKKIVKKTIPGFEENVRGALKRWNDAVTNNDLDVLLSRQYIKDNKGILKSGFYKDLVGNARAAEIEADEALALREAKATIEQAEKGLKTGDLKGTDAAKLNAKKTRDFNKVVKGTITEAVDGTVDALMDNPYLEQLIKEYEKKGISSDVSKQYIIYQWLYDNSGKSGVLQDIAFRYYNAPSKVSEIKITSDAARAYSRKFQKAAESIIESKLNKLVAKIQEEGTDDLVDMESTAKRVEEYFKDITDLWGSKRVIEAWDREAGKFKYYQVDHSTYNLVTNYPTFKRNNLFARTMARINSIARFGQITIRAASLVTQGFKDTFDAVILGGWDQLLLDNPNTYKKIAEYIGPDVVDAFRRSMTPDAWKDFLAAAEWSGLSVEEAIAKAEVNNELLQMKIEGGPGTSTSYFSYRNLYEPTDEVVESINKQLEAANDTWTADTKAKWKEAYEKARVAWYNASQKGQGVINRVEDYANFLHNARETFLRKQVYRQNFMEALESGKSLAQARNYASYFMRNATTNFTRGFAWGDNIIRSIPYFGAMMNGASSMVRLLEVDPLGIMMRFTTDLIIPTVGLVAMSLEDPRDAELYMNIPEWEKEGNLHWVANGEVITIPLPEELAKFILPIRHAVESMYSANKHAFGELLLNDILNLPTIPLNSVMLLDWNKANGDPTVWDRLSALGMDLFNTLAPNAGRTAYIATTGKDPYTGEDYGKKKLYVDENGEYQYMTVSEYGFANDMAELFKGWGWDVSAIMAEAMFSSIFGTGSLDVAEGIRDFVVTAQEGNPDITALISPSLERAGNVMTGVSRTDADQARISWYGVINELRAKKNEMLAPDGKLAKYSQDIDMAKDINTLNKKTELYDSEVRNWQNMVIDRIKQYNSVYGDYYDRSKLASTISLLTTNLSIDRVRNSDNYYNARALAIETMMDAGFDSPSDNSVFGYVYRDPYSGKVGIKYTDPLIISLSQNLLWYQADEAVQMMKDQIELSGLKDKYNKEVYPKYNNAMNAKNYTEANKIAADWDVELIKAVKPIIDEYTVDELLNKSTVIDLLDNYVLVPSTTDAMGKGKYYSSKTGLNKRRGFAQSYIKKIYGRLKEEK